jgi:hypothetical protein
MRSLGLWALSLACAFGCESGDEGASTGVPGASGSSSGSAGSAPTGGAAGAPASGGPAAGGVTNGGAGGSATTTGGNSAGASMSGGIGGSASGGAAAGGPSGGRSSGGRSNAGGGGSGGAAVGGQSGGAGGASQKAGAGGGGASAGAGGCVENLACKLQAPPTTGDLHQDCVDRINQFRTQCACLPALARRTDGEACADEMAQYDAEQNEAHAGHSDKICEPSGSQNSCPGYSSNNQVIGLCLQQMWDEGPPPMDPCTGECFQEYGHFINMTSTTVNQVACGFFTTSAGKVWSVQNFSR